MSIRPRHALLSLLVAAAVPIAAFAAGPSAYEWEIGPIIKGRSSSVNMPRTMEDSRDGPTFAFPSPGAGHVNYVTVPIRSLEGAQRITLTYRIDAARGVRFVPREAPEREALLSLYFQRAGDRWTARTPHHRWYSPDTRVVPLRLGTHTISIALDEPWKAMMGGNGHTLPAQFDRAKAEAARIGFVFGASGGRGHGVYATGPARFTVLDFRIE